MDDSLPAPPVLEGELVAAKPKSPHLWQKGVSGNPKGRPPGSKQKIGEAFLKDLMKWHAKHGMKAIEQVGRKKPEELLRIMASLIPKHDILEVGHHVGSIPVVELQELERRSFELLSRIADGNAQNPGQD